MKYCTMILAFLATASAAWAQQSPLSADTVNLGTVYENVADSALVYIKNQGDVAVEIDRIVGFPYYGDTVVVSNFAGGLLPAQDSIGVWVSAKPMHNLVHRGSLLVLTKQSPFGTTVVPYKFQGRYSKSYYNATENKSEAALRTQLKSTITAGQVQYSYNAARDEMYADIDNVSGDVECVYTGRLATFNTRPGANSNNFNCEHTWPQSLFNESLPMRSDIHHLFPTDVTANSERGNYPFGIVANPTWQNGGSKKAGNLFEPRDVQKGATARAMMYFVLRYQDYANFYVGQKTILRQWDLQFPPSAMEQTRNEDIFQFQNNRNPFVDYPQFAARITNLVGTTFAPDVFQFHVSEDTIHMVHDPSALATNVYVVNIYNYGNAEINLSNFALSNTALQFVNGSGVNHILQPGENAAIGIEYPLAVDFTNEALTFATDVLNHQNMVVPINSANVFGVDENEWNPQLKITNSQISWPQVHDLFRWQLIDMRGRILLSGDSQERESINLSTYANGIYILQMNGKKGPFVQKINVVNR